MEPNEVEIRVLGCLLEKERATPYVYPLSIDSLRRGCNQSRSRDPVVAYEEPEIAEALSRLSDRGWVKADDGSGRVVKYRHVLDGVFELDSRELALLAVLLLRGVQTAGELRERSERLQGFGSVREVHESLGRLVERGFVVRHERRAGQKEERYEQQLGTLDAERLAAQSRKRAGSEEVDDGSENPTESDAGIEEDGAIGGNEEPSEEEAESAVDWGEVPGEEVKDDDAAASGATPAGAIDTRIDWLEAEVVKLRAQLTALLKELGK